MEAAIDSDAPLDYASIQIFPSQNRYEAFVCKEKQSENMAAGHLEHLLPHLPGINNLCTKGFDAKFDLELPDNLHGAEWFPKATFKRFLDAVNSPDLLNFINTCMDEMSQLEESKKFHLSLYGKDHLESEERDGCSSYGVAPTSKPEVNIAASNSSKNELLRAMDLRLTALSNKIKETFNKAIGATFSPKDMLYLVKFSQHFGATNIENSLCRLIELNQSSQDVGPLNNDTTFFTGDMENDDANRAVKNPQISKPVVPLDAPVRYGVSPAKAALVERQNSTESEESSNSIDEGQALKSHSLMRSASPRRSASPMRRIQIGRSGPRRAAALTIKSLDVFPARERPIFSRDTAENGCDGEASEQYYKKPEIDVKRITVQDAINLFESKQRDPAENIQSIKSLTNLSISTKKSVLRRWSTGMGETSVQDQPEIVPADPVPVTSNDVECIEIPNDSKDVVSNFISESHSNYEMTDCDVKSERRENIGSYTVDNQAATELKVGKQIVKRLAASSEWNKRKHAEFNQILKKMTESKSVKFGKSQPSKNQNMPSEQRGGSYDHYKEKRDAKLRGENARKRVEREQFQEMQVPLDKRKTEMASNNVNKKNSARKSQKSLRNSSQPANSPKKISKPSVTKMMSPKTSSMPATHKSRSSTPSSIAAGTSAAKVRGGISSASRTLTLRKPKLTAYVPHPSQQREKSQQRNRNEKETQTDNVRSLKSMNEKRQPTVPNKSNGIEAKVMTASGETRVPSKLTLHNKGNKKSSVVPLESKPFLRKGSGIGHGTGNLNKQKNPPLEKSCRECEDLTEGKESGLFVIASDSVNQHSDEDTVTPSHQNTATEPEAQTSNRFQCDVKENLDQAPTDGDVLTNIEESSSIIKTEEQSTISPSAWEEIQEELELPKPCEDSTFQPASLANIPPAGLASPCVRHSLFQMLQEESCEPDTSGLGNAEVPPAMIFQKDAPKGFKRLLKFARKSKGDTGSTGWSSPSVFSEGEDDTEEFQNTTRRNADNLLRKAALNAKGYGQPKSSLREGYERNLGSKIDDKGSYKMQEGCDSGAGPTTKAPRSFFSLSAFRGSKPSETKFH